MSGLTARLARWAANSARLPTAHRAVLGYYAETGTFDYRALELKSRVDETMERILSELFADVENELAREFGVSEVEFEYETKLTLPAELTLGYLYRRAFALAADGYDPVADEVESSRLPVSLPGLGGRRDGAADRRRGSRDAAQLVADAEEATAFAVAALLDGDMRDAINDGEFEDFVVDLDLADGDRRRVAEVAQAYLQERVEEGFSSYPDSVRAKYDHAVDVSEAHQDQDERFRELMTAARPAGTAELAAAGDTREAHRTDPDAVDPDSDPDAVDLDPESAREAIESEYKHRAMADDDHPFTAEELDLPYLTTQYDRVGVIYHGMLEMYREGGFDIEPAFERSIVFAIIGAQIWLDDVDDYADDVAEGQLTPVTAEYLLASSEREAFETILDTTGQYFELARSYAVDADSTLTGIAVEYILRSGDVSHLPGAASSDRDPLA